MHAFCVLYTKFSPNPGPQRISPVFFFKVFYSFRLYIWVYDPFWGSFYLGLRSGLRCLFVCLFAYRYPLFQHLLWKRPSFLLWIALISLSKPIDQICGAYSWTLFYSIDLRVCSGLSLRRLYRALKSSSGRPPTLHFALSSFFKLVLVTLVPLLFRIGAFQNQFVDFYKSADERVTSPRSQSSCTSESAHSPTIFMDPSSRSDHTE